MTKYKELVARKEKLEEEYQRSKNRLEKQAEIVRKKEQDLHRLEGELAIAVIKEHGLNASELADLLSDLNASPTSADAEASSSLEQGGYA